jgi:hypothetical protein
VVGELLSYEPYGIMFARDDAPLANAVDAAFRRLYSSRELRRIDNKWFLRPLPSGVRLGLRSGLRGVRVAAALAPACRHAGSTGSPRRT